MGACVGGLYSIDGVGPRVVPQSAITDHRTCIVAVVDLDRAEMEQLRHSAAVEAHQGSRISQPQAASVWPLHQPPMGMGMGIGLLRSGPCTSPLASPHASYGVYSMPGRCLRYSPHGVHAHV